MRNAICLIGLFLMSLAAGAAEKAPSVEVRAMGILRDNCVSCHNPEKKKGKLVLTTREGALKGGEDGVVLVPGDASDSRLARALLAESDSHMPPKGQLTADEIAAVRAWIDAGANWDLAEMKRVRTPSTGPVVLRAIPASYRPVLCMAISPDQKRLAVGRGDRVLIYDLAGKDRPLLREMGQANDLVQSLAWSSDGAWLAAGGFRRIVVYESGSGNVVREIGGLGGRVTAMVFMPKEPVLIAGEGEVGTTGSVRMWRLPEGKAAGDWPAHGDSILAMKISADGKRLATAGADKLAKVWEISGKKEIAKLEGHAGPVMAVALSADGQMLASGGADKEIKLWNVTTREQTAALTTSPSAVTDMTWANAKTLLSAGEDGTARFSTEANATRADKVLSGAGDVLYCVSITADEKWVFGGCHDGSVYVWSGAGKLEGKLGKPEARNQKSE